MKKPARKKPKFYKGQVVYATLARTFFKIVSRRFHREENCYQYLEIWTQHDESELRPLTATEIGPRRKRG